MSFGFMGETDSEGVGLLDTAQLSLDFDSSFFEDGTRLGTWQRSICDRFGLHGSVTHAPFIPSSGEIVSPLMALFRLMSVDEHEGALVLASLESNPFTQASSLNEQYALQALQSALQTLLASFPTTLDEDNGVLREVTGADLDSSRRRLAVRQRRVQKVILTRALNRLQARL